MDTIKKTTMKSFLFILLICLQLTSFAQIKDIKLAYNSLNDNSLSFTAFYHVLKYIDQISPPNDSIITIIDFTKPSTAKRFYVINLKTSEILIKTYVAHGMKTGENFAVHFSNQPNTQQSSPGFYITGQTYTGKHGYSLKLNGIEQGINDNAYKRAIVVHGAWYVSEDFIKKNGRLGRSFGCPALEEDISKAVIDIIKNGTILYIYTKDENYWKLTKYK